MTYDPAVVRTLYKKLLGLYPQAFRERLGESMEQTFDDLWNERKQQARGGWLGFVLWTFAETAIGIVQEYTVSIKEMTPMNYTLPDLRASALISFFLLLPFMLLSFVFDIGKRLNTFSLRNAVDLVGVFGFLWLGLAAILLILLPIVRSVRPGRTAAAAPERAPASGITARLTHPGSAAIIGVLLALPFMSLLSLLILNIEPPTFGPLELLLNNPDPDQPNVLGSLIVLGTFLLAILACLIVRAPIVRAMRAGGSLLAHPVNLMLAAVILFFIASLVISLMIDQYPCWIGVPNCD